MAMDDTLAVHVTQREEQLTEEQSNLIHDDVMMMGVVMVRIGVDRRLVADADPKRIVTVDAHVH